MSSSSIFAIAGSALTAQAQRMNVSASNLANAESVDGPNGAYRAQQVRFESDAIGDGISGVRVAGVSDDPAPMNREYRPGDPLADEQGYIEKPNVNPTDEMVNMISAARSYEASLEVLNTSKSLMLRTLTLGQ